MRVYSCTATHSSYDVPQQAKEWSHGVAWSTKEGSAEEFDDADDTYIPLPPPKIQNTCLMLKEKPKMSAIVELTAAKRKLERKNRSMLEKLKYKEKKWKEKAIALKLAQWQI